MTSRQPARLDLWPLAVAVGLALCLTLAPAAPAGAETSRGIRLGIANSKLANDGPAEDTGRIYGFVAGVYLSHEVLPGFALAPELLYAKKGGEYSTLVLSESGEPLGRGRYAYNLHYLELPVLARVGLPLLGSVVPSLVAGPRVSWKLSGKGKLEGDVPPDLAGEEDLDWLEDVDYGLIAGVSFQLGMGPAHANVDLRFDWGLSNLNEDGPAEIKNRSVMVLAGVGF